VGTIGPRDVYALYSHHREWPLDGHGVAHGQLFAPTSAGLEPLRTWLTRRRWYVLCPLCGALLNFDSPAECPGPFEHVIDWLADEVLSAQGEDPWAGATSARLFSAKEVGSNSEEEMQ